MAFVLPEYAVAEKEFVGEALTELAQSRGGIAALIGREPTSRPGSTRLTVDSGEVVEFDPVGIRAAIILDAVDITDTRADALIVALDSAAGEYHEALERMIFENLGQLTEATGNQVDAAGKDLNDAMYEALETMEISFEEDGSVSSSLAIVVSPEMAEKLAQAEAEMTAEQRQRLDELFARKREEFFARRRRRKLS